MHAVLALNSGSSSIKFALYRKAPKDLMPSLLCRGELEGIPHSLHFSARDHQVIFEDTMIKEEPNFKTALGYLLKWIKTTYPQVHLQAAGHRIVHGGTRFTHAVRVDEEGLAYLEGLSPLAPLHQLHNLAGIRTLQAIYPSLPQIACFDTSFHHTQPQLETLFALPYHFWEEGVRRYGFHGLSYQYISEVLEETVGKKGRGRVVVAHLGHGASLCALKDLKSIATSMGLTALDGLPMGTRCGAIDPGVLLYLAGDKGYSTDKLTQLLYKDSGLLGLSSISGDMQVLLKSKDPFAELAIDYFCYRIQRELGSLVAALGGLDVLVFTAGIGENAAEVRQKVCSGLKWLNIEIDEALNSSLPPHQAVELTASVHHPAVWVIPTDEEIIIAKDVFDLISMK